MPSPSRQKAGNVSLDHYELQMTLQPLHMRSKQTI